MNGVIINPNSVNSVIASSGIAHYLSKKFNIPIYGKHNYRELKKKKFDYLFLMNSGFGCVQDQDFGPWIPDMVMRSKRPILVANDYKLLYPCGYTRHILPKQYLYWSTVPEYSGKYCEGVIYVNWNKLTYRPQKIRNPKVPGCIYWGAYRQHRIEYFEKYLNSKFVTISTSKRALKGFEESCPKAKKIDNLEKLYYQIQDYYCTLYIEDYTRKYCSPANRFYEAISAGIPMFFQPESVEHMEEAGYDVRPFVVENSYELFNRIMGISYGGNATRKAQLKWRRNYIKELDKEVDEAMRRT